jgi:DDE superfamily endonuclease
MRPEKALNWAKIQVTMYFLLKFPQIVEQYAPRFEHLFSPEGYRYFRRYLSGLLVCNNKTLEHINSCFVLEPRNQSSFNRFVTKQRFDLKALNGVRVQMMQDLEVTAFKPSSGVLAVDDSLLSHYGKHFDNIYRLYDHVSEHYTNAHNLVSLHYSDDSTDYSVFNELWLPPNWELVAQKMRELNISINQNRWDKRHEDPSKWREYIRNRFNDRQYTDPAIVEVYKTKVHMALGMLRRFKEEFPHLDLPVTMDNGYTGADICRILDEDLKMSYVGNLSPYHQIELAGSEKIPLQDFVVRLIKQHNEGKPRFIKTTVPYKGKKEVYYAYCVTHRIHRYSNPQRLVISFKKQDLSDKPFFSISNRLHWFASGILRIRRHRWPIESFHQEGKAEGLDKYQLQNFDGITSHISFVSIAYTMLKRAVYDFDLLSALQLRLGISKPLDTLPMLRKTTQLDNLLQLVQYVSNSTKSGKSVEDIFRQLTKSLN